MNCRYFWIIFSTASNYIESTLTVLTHHVAGVHTNQYRYSAATVISHNTESQCRWEGLAWCSRCYNSSDHSDRR